MDSRAPLIPGLANLHGRLGFNNSHHLLAALFSAGHWAGTRQPHPERLHRFAGAGLCPLRAGPQSVRAATQPSAVLLFAAALFAPTIGLVLFGVFGPAISTLKADVFVTAGIILLSCAFLGFAGTAPGTPEYRASAATAILVGCLLATVKLSAAAFCGVIVLAVVIRAARDIRKGLSEPFSGRLIVAAGVAGVLLLAGFLARGVVLSGYPLYPSSAFGLDVDWRVPLAQVDADRVFIKTWSQLRPTYDLARVANQEWVKGWLNSLILTQKLSIILPVVLITVLGGREGFSSDSRENPSRPRFPGEWAFPVLLGASLLSLLVWLTQAPAARFASIYFWIPLAAIIATTARRGTPEPGAGRLLGVALGCVALTVFVVTVLLRYSQVEALQQPGIFAVVAFGALWGIAFLTVHHHPNVLWALCVVLGFSQIGERAVAHAVRGRLDEIGAMAWYNTQTLPREPTFEHMVRQTRSGLTLYVSKSASFRTPIPNTRYFNPYLELRTPGELRSGFRNRGNAAVAYGYTVDYVLQPNAGTEIVVPASE